MGDVCGIQIQCFDIGNAPRAVNNAVCGKFLRFAIMFKNNRKPVAVLIDLFDVDAGFDINADAFALLGDARGQRRSPCAARGSALLQEWKLWHQHEHKHGQIQAL